MSPLWLIVAFVAGAVVGGGGVLVFLAHAVGTHI
jgi:hypothetical protein